MSVYTKAGDAGMTSLIKTKNVSKTDHRIECLGTIDELTSNLGLVKVQSKAAGYDYTESLERIQRTLMTVMAGIADSYNMKYKIKLAEVEYLESEIDQMEAAFPRKKEFILPGGNLLTAQMDVTRTIARRAERCLAAVSIQYGSDPVTKKYMNRLADYIYILARYTDWRIEKGAANMGDMTNTTEDINDTVIAEVMKRMQQMQQPKRMTLDIAKKLIERIEAEASRRGKKAVIAICGPDGNPIAVHVMDDAFLVSFDVATKKAYTSVAVKMSTMELSKLAQPGGTFYGVDKLDGGKIVIFGGGVPLKIGEQIVGGLGISGGTGEEDHSLAEYALSIFPEIIA